MCPKCKKAELRKEELYAGALLKRKKKVIFFCPLCNFENVKEFNINEQQYMKGVGINE